jgi:hypothetical protein
MGDGIFPIGEQTNIQNNQSNKQTILTNKPTKLIRLGKWGVGFFGVPFCRNPITICTLLFFSSIPIPSSKQLQQHPTTLTPNNSNTNNNMFILFLFGSHHFVVFNLVFFFQLKVWVVLVFFFGVIIN